MRRFLVLVAAAGEQTDTFRRTKTTFDFTHMDTGVKAVPGHYQPGSQSKSPATARVVTEGGPRVGTLQLTLLTPLFFALPTERVWDGQIRIH
jgi:hypothetical protein